VSGSGNAPSVTLYYEGDSDCHWEIPVNTEILDNSYVNVTGDTMTGTLNLPSNGLVVGTNQLVASGGSIGIGESSPDSAALLELSSTTKGFLPPRMTTTQRDAISNPPAGLMIYNTTTNKLNFYNGTAWEEVTSS